MRTPLYTVKLLYSNTLKWGHLCLQCNSSIPTTWNEDTFVYSEPLYSNPWNEDTFVYSETPLFQPLKWGHLCLQWNSSIPTTWNEDTSVYSGTPLFQPPAMRTPLYTPLFQPSKRGQLCMKWNPSIPTLEMRTSSCLNCMYYRKRFMYFSSRIYTTINSPCPALKVNLTGCRKYHQKAL